MKPIGELQEKINRVTHLPTLPQVATRLIKTINNPNTSSSDVAFVVGQDLSLSAKVLRLANSAFYGMPRSITNINNAVVILGLRVINTMVLSLTVFDMFPGDKNRVLFDRQAFWRHSLGCGVTAKMLADRMRRFALIDPEEAFCAGLLHDIGKVVLEQYVHDEFRTALAYAAEHKTPGFEAEMRVLGASHTDVAGWLTADWDLPAELQAPLVYHHTPLEAGQCLDIVALCHYADHLCYQTGLALDEEYTPPTLDRQAVDVLRLSDADIEDVCISLPNELEKMHMFLEIACGR